MTARSSVTSLQHLCTYKIIDNLHLFEEVLPILPAGIKNLLLHRFNSARCYWKNVEYKKILPSLLHDKTRHLETTLYPIDDDILKIMERCGNLQKLYLTNNADHDISFKGLASLLRKTQHLQMLQVCNTYAVTDELLEIIAENCPKLVGLDIAGCVSVTDAGLATMAVMNNLMWLTFSNTNITDEGIKAIVSGNSSSKIRELRLGNCDLVTSNVLRYVSQHCPEIKILEFYNFNRQLTSNADLSDSNFDILENSNLKLQLLSWVVPW